MFFKNNKIIRTDKLYNKILDLSREKSLYTKMRIDDAFNSRITLIFFHLSFLLIRLKSADSNDKKISQIIFDYFFNQIEIDIREIGFGDVAVNKKMKDFVRFFYGILTKCENFKELNNEERTKFIQSYFYSTKKINNENITVLNDYFDKYRLFCMNLTIDSIKKGDISFFYY